MTGTLHDDIPILDLQDVGSGDVERETRAAAAIARGLGRYGLVYVKNHGIDPAALDAFYTEFLALTALPEAEKRRWARADLWFQRGYTPPNTEKAVVAGGQPDFKECWFAAPIDVDPVAAELYPEIHPPNVWPENRPHFRTFYEAIGLALHEAGLALLRACADALSLPRETFVDVTRGAPHVTRALKYLPLDAQQCESGVLWGEEHTDFNLLTLLPGGWFLDRDQNRCARPDDRSGLFLRTRGSEGRPGGELVPGTAPPGCIVAQVGQQLEILTGGRLLATPHVITAPKTPGYARTSMAHFVHVHTDTRLFPLPPFQTRETMTAYRPPVLAGTYDIKTLVDIGLAPPEVLSKLGYRHYDRLASVRAGESR
ncbi:isopenicillin N synthase family dioxygenase [Polyangium mundeleinium]|uniref:2-oxoglutarate and iron-dependent oxygenase domain-containing protein n=1 Tax=Polyangium mundeleinium TaxID=2995306 RepID=A0ABT5EMU2_9BACT|nr:2-oxoglutarate and iron-dependent oxygenase domain-containing protein [Polyangium mundeleinium]MDC0743149.1 2-oxoglutarate and iron-dependent oxygenase domain-containing protein [Polyangium mundeleinium]